MLGLFPVDVTTSVALGDAVSERESELGACSGDAVLDELGATGRVCEGVDAGVFEGVGDALGSWLWVASWDDSPELVGLI